MANLDSIHTWERWAPNVGDNRTRKGGPVIYLELATGLTAAQVAGIGAKIRDLAKLNLEPVVVEKDATPEEVDAATAQFRQNLDAFKDATRAVWVEALSSYVRVEDGPHTVQGQPLANLNDYAKLVQQRADFGFTALRTLRDAVESFNSFEGPDELF